MMNTKFTLLNNLILNTYCNCLAKPTFEVHKSLLYFPEMGVMPEIGQAVEEMDWR